MAEPLLNVTVRDGKYTVRQESDGHLHALRYGEPWARDIVGDKLVLTLAQEVDDLRQRLAEIHSWIVCAPIAPAVDMMQNAAHIEAVADIAQPYTEGHPHG